MREWFLEIGGSKYLTSRLGHLKSLGQNSDAYLIGGWSVPEPVSMFRRSGKSGTTSPNLNTNCRSPNSQPYYYTGHEFSCPTLYMYTRRWVLPAIYDNMSSVNLHVPTFLETRQSIFLLAKAVHSGFGGLEVAYWPLEPKFAGWNPAEAVGFFRAKKNPQHALFSEGK
jgi:hypothetical protein